jgi:hypothetical protein
MSRIAKASETACIAWSLHLPIRLGRRRSDELQKHGFFMLMTFLERSQIRKITTP